MLLFLLLLSLKKGLCGAFPALGPFLADSSENFSTERPVFAPPRPTPCPNGGTQNFEPNFWEIPRCTFQLFHFSRLFQLWDLSWWILWKISVPNAPFSWRLLPPVSRKFGTQDFLLNVWRIPRCSFSAGLPGRRQIINNSGRGGLSPPPHPPTFPRPSASCAAPDASPPLSRRQIIIFRRPPGRRQIINVSLVTEGGRAPAPPHPLGPAGLPAGGKSLMGYILRRSSQNVK